MHLPKKKSSFFFFNLFFQKLIKFNRDFENFKTACIPWESRIKEVESLLISVYCSVLVKSVFSACFLKVHPKMKNLSSFTQPQVAPNLYECLYSAKHKGRYFEESL